MPPCQCPDVQLLGDTAGRKGQTGSARGTVYAAVRELCWASHSLNLRWAAASRDQAHKLLGWFVSSSSSTPMLRTSCTPGPRLWLGRGPRWVNTAPASADLQILQPSPLIFMGWMLPSSTGRSPLLVHPARWQHNEWSGEIRKRSRSSSPSCWTPSVKPWQHKAEQVTV